MAAMKQKMDKYLQILYGGTCGVFFISAERVALFNITQFRTTRFKKY